MAKIIETLEFNAENMREIAQIQHWDGIQKRIEAAAKDGNQRITSSSVLPEETIEKLRGLGFAVEERRATTGQQATEIKW